MMKARSFVSAGLLCCLVVGPIACGGNPDDSNSDDLAVDGDADGNTGDDFGTDTGGGSGQEQLDGGTKDLTGDQVDAIKNAQCSGYNGEAEPAPAILQFVVDVSLSMQERAPGGGGSKWDVTRRALLDAIDGLPASMAVGLQLFPTAESDSACVTDDGRVAIDQLGPAGSAHRNALAQMINGANLYIGTPTHDAYHIALEESLKPYGGEGKKFMLLITDGAPTQSINCSGLDSNGVPTEPIVDEIRGASGEGVGTFIIGSPGSEASMTGEDMRPWLSEAAREGGTAQANCSDTGPTYCHFDMSAEPNFAGALTDGLREITGSVSNPCSFEIPSDAPTGTTIDPNKTNVIIEWSSGSAALIIRDDQGDCSEGWRVASNGQLELCGGTCDRIKGDASARVTLSFGCASGEIPDFE
jgi:hypothetical protein